MLVPHHKVRTILTRTRVCVYIYTHTYTHKDKHTCMPTNTAPGVSCHHILQYLTNGYPPVTTNIFTYIHTYTHTHTHAYKHRTWRVMSPYLTILDEWVPSGYNHFSVGPRTRPRRTTQCLSSCCLSQHCCVAQLRRVGA